MVEEDLQSSRRDEETDHGTDVAAYLRRHDLVFESPPTEGWEGLPLGNGRLGGPLWVRPEGPVFQINHTDAYELPDPERRDEGWAVLRSCGRLFVEHAVAPYDWIAMNHFEGRLALGTATASLHARTAFGDFGTTAYVHAEHPVAVIEHRAAYRDAVGATGAPVRVSLERWGSRVFGWWYNTIHAGAGMGLGPCRAWVDGKDACLELPLRGVRVAVRCRIVGAKVAARVVHDHRVELEVAGSAVQDFRILLACLTSHESDDPTAAARDAIATVERMPEAYDDHRRWWGSYWNRSFLHVSEDYVENLYYLHHYLMGSSARGHYPPLFNGALWIWNRDVRNWVNPHHWNQQMAHWCLPAADRCDLLAPYLDTYHRLMPHGRALAQRRGFGGMLWNEMHDFAGRQLGEQSENMRDNLTPASQIALFFWWHYRFTGDRERLRIQGYPYLRDVGDFYLDWVRWDEAREVYELPLACTYEEYDRFEEGRIPRFTDSVTNLAMIRALFAALLAASEDLEIDEPRRDRWRHVLDRLPPYALNDRDTERGVTLGSGLLDGRELPAKENHNHGPLFCPIVPAGDLGLKDEGSVVFEAACNTVLTYPPAANCITPTVAVAARLGLPDEALRRVDAMVRNLQLFPNGLFFNLDWWFTHSRYSPTSLDGWANDLSCVTHQRDYLDDRGAKYRGVHVRASQDEGVQEHHTDTPAWPFTQPGLESHGLLAFGLQEMLLQSHEGAIRVFPAVPDSWAAEFVLLAAGCFRVESRREPFGLPVYVSITSLHGGTCRLIVPWPDGAQLFEGDVAACREEADGRSVLVCASPGDRYLFGPVGCGRPDTASPREIVTNDRPKRYREATIGKQRNY